MSYTELYKFKKDGNAEDLGEVKNAWRGAMAVWRIVEKKYLAPVPKPSWMSQEDYNERGYSRCSMSPSFNESAPNPLQEVWSVFNDDKVSNVDKIVLGSTFDNAVVMRENIDEVIKAFNEFEGETSLKEQAKLLKDSLKDDDLIAIAWNQTSVCGDTWTNIGGYDEKGEEYLPYNISVMDKHFNLFDEINN